MSADHSSIAAGGPDQADWPADAVEVARVAGAWGVKGALKLQPFAADPQALFSSRRWFVEPAPGPRPSGAVPGPRLLHVSQVREQGESVVAQVREVGDRDGAEALKGARIFVSRASFPTPAADEYYWVDLIGVTVSNREGVDFGRVVDLIQTGPHCVLRVRADGKPGGAEPLEAERLIPFVSAYVDDVDLAARRMRVNWGADF